MSIVNEHRPRRFTTTLRFVESTEDYSLYREVASEDNVYLAHGTGARLVDSWHLDLSEEWDAYINATRSTPSTVNFCTDLKQRVFNPEVITDEVIFCWDCARVEWADDCSIAGHGEKVCESCWDENYYPCSACNQKFRETTTTMHETEICSGCLEQSYSYCEECDGWHHNNYASAHQHEGCPARTPCESPAQVFTVRNDGAEPLANDTRITITLGKGEIDETGILEIRGHLRNHAYWLDDADPDQAKFRLLAYDLETLGNKVQEKRGNYTKRLSSHAYKHHQLKVPPDVLSRIGNIVSDHSRAVDFEVEVTRNLNLPREQFAHEGSCWWTDYAASRCALKTNGGFGLRTFDEHGVRGRAWVMPVLVDEENRARPTFETLDPHAFVVFNGYGDLSEYAPARIVAHMAGWTYKKIDFEVAPMYVNNTSGYLIAPEEICARFTERGIFMELDQHADLYANEHNHTEEISHV